MKPAGAFQHFPYGLRIRASFFEVPAVRSDGLVIGWAPRSQPLGRAVPLTGPRPTGRFLFVQNVQTTRPDLYKTANSRDPAPQPARKSGARKWFSNGLICGF